MLYALVRLIGSNLLGNLWIALSNLPRLVRLGRRPRWVTIRIEERMVARPPRRRLFRRAAPSIAGLSRLVGELSADRVLEGVVVEIEAAPGGWATLQTLRGLFARLRGAGKRVVAHLSGASLREYYLACAADSILADESATLRLLGVAAEVTFFAEALAKIGVEAQLEARGKYKSFAEPFTRRDMSEAHREALDALLDQIDGELRRVVAEGREVSAERAAELVAGGPYTAPEAEKVGLLDAVRYADEVASWLGDPKRPPASVAAWKRARLRRLRWKPLRRRRRVRVLALHGALVAGEGAVFPRRLLGARAAGRALRAARKDRRTAAAVLHIDCRGGSAQGADQIWREALLCARAKPVVAFFSDVAASGGYYLACAATRIVAQPLSLTGSIGVVAGKLSLAGLYERAGLGTAILTRGDAAAMDLPARGYSEEERRRLRREVDAIYDQFVRRVSEGRRLSRAEAEAAAQGRVWSGADARERKLLDELGDADAAIELARTLAGRPGEVLDVSEVTPEPKRAGMLGRMFARQLASALPEPARLPEPAGALLDLAAVSRERVWALPVCTLHWLD